MKSICKCLCIFLLLVCVMAPGYAADKSKRAGDIVKNISADGACAIVGMRPEQSQLTALQRARAAARTGGGRIRDLFHAGHQHDRGG